MEVDFIMLRGEVEGTGRKKIQEGGVDLREGRSSILLFFFSFQLSLRSSVSLFKTEIRAPGKGNFGVKKRREKLTTTPLFHRACTEEEKEIQVMA